MPRCCSVVGCKSNYKSEGVFVSTFALPKDEDLKRKWIQSIPTDLSRLKNPIICLKHFDPSDVNWIDKCTVKGEVKEYFRKIPKLKVGALPCIFSNVPDELSASLKVKEENEMHFSENCDSEEWFEESKTVIVPNDYWNVESIEVQNEQQEETGQSVECIIPKKEKIESNEEEEAETCPPFCLVLVEEEPFEIEDTAESDVFEPEGHLCPELPKEGEGVVHPNEGASLLTKRRQTVPGIYVRDINEGQSTCNKRVKTSGSHLKVDNDGDSTHNKGNKMTERPISSGVPAKERMRRYRLRKKQRANVATEVVRSCVDAEVPVNI